MLLFGSSVTFVFLGYSIAQSEAIKGSVGKQKKPLIWNRGRSVLNYTPRCDSSCPHHSLAVHVESKGEAIGDGFLESESVEALYVKYPLVGGKNEDYKSSTLEPGPNGLPLLCTERECRVAHLSENEYFSGGSGIERREKNWEANERECRVAHLSENEYISGGSGIERREKNWEANDMYYESMLEANPGNFLLLKDYAKFLHEVHHDIAKAEEYYGRAMLANPEDAELLALYATFTSETQNDAAQAEDYFDRAVKAAPDDCYIVSSYAHFLWKSEEDQNDDHVDLQSVEDETCKSGR